MADADRERWDRAYGKGLHIGGDAPEWLARFTAQFPEQGRALDVASGTGRIACWLAAQGLDVLAVDVSQQGLRLARERAERDRVSIETLCRDLEQTPPPEGPFDVITCFHYLQRELFPQLVERLAHGGVLICEHKTVLNLERHAKPSAHFLLEPDELPRLCAPLDIEHHEEDWIDDRALTRIVARRRA